jgi:hypothetical protein
MLRCINFPSSYSSRPLAALPILVSNQHFLLAFCEEYKPGCSKLTPPNVATLRAHKSKVPWSCALLGFSLEYHTVFLRTLRVALDVEVRSGKEHACRHGLSNLWRVWDRLTPGQRPLLMCGDANYSNERLMAQCEERGQKYLFRQRSTQGVRQLVRWLEGQGGWQPLTDGWSGAEGQLQLTGWTRQRRTVVLRRKRPDRSDLASLPLLADRGVVLRCQIAARMVALVYNWWNLFVRCAEPARAREAITSRPMLLHAVGRLVKSGGQTILRLTSQHAEASHIQSVLSKLSLFLSGPINTAEQFKA